ncbi:Uncharacterised protein [Starkeya nomas]|uniref:Uncharacterized protein n=1 Tax=Starkeya nomas TaxID=2666134 RepID=A0A5S9NZ79_9HYPH|nr:hypothetical protein [Starkeya nomas]CAA0096217.1 Uncharacterised protein [Starkeya nomas]
MMDHVFRWDRCGRKGELCHVFARGAMNSVGVRFADGWTMVTSRYAVRRLVSEALA